MASQGLEDTDLGPLLGNSLLKTEKLLEVAFKKFQKRKILLVYVLLRFLGDFRMICITDDGKSKRGKCYLQKGHIPALSIY